jgi:glutamate mutase epsilon subunit
LAGDVDRSEALAEEAIRIARGVPLRQVLVVALTRAAQAAVLSANHSRARLVLAELLRLLRDLGARRWVADALDATALVLETDDRLEAAARLLGASESLRRTLSESSTGLPALVARVSACRDRIAERLGLEAVVIQESIGKAETLQEVLNCALADLEHPKHPQ